MIDEVKYCNKSKELIELGFRPNMCLNNDDADKYMDDFYNLKDEMKEYYGFNIFVKLGE